MTLSKLFNVSVLIFSPVKQVKIAPPHRVLVRITWVNTCRVIETVTGTIIIIRWHWVGSYESPRSWRRGSGLQFEEKIPEDDRIGRMYFGLVWWIFILLDADSDQNKQKRQRGLFSNPYMPSKVVSNFLSHQIPSTVFSWQLCYFFHYPLGDLGQTISLSGGSLSFLLHRDKQVRIKQEKGYRSPLKMRNIA